MNKLFNTGVLIALAIFFGRVSGFYREIFIAGNFGVTQYADYAIFLLVIPEFIITFLISGAVGAVLIPAMKRLNKHQGYFLYLQVSAIVLVLFFLISCCLYWRPNYLVSFLVPGFSTEEVKLLSKLVKTTIWILPISGLTGVVIAYLQNLEIFFIPALGTLIFNITILCCGAVCFNLNKIENLTFLSNIILVAGVVRMLPLYFLIPKYKDFDFEQFRWLLDFTMLRKYFEIIISSGVTIFIPIVIGAFASYFGQGTMASFNYANKLIQLPIGIFLSVFSVVLLPKISELFAEEKVEEAGHVYLVSIYFILLLSVLLVIFMSLSSTQFVALVYGRGSINTDQQLTIINLVKIGVFCIPAVGLSNIFSVYFNAKLDSRDNLYINLAVLVYMIITSFLIAKYFSYYQLMLNMAIGYWLIAALQFISLIKKYQLKMSLRGVKILYP